MEISSQQLAEILVGVARAQAALVQALDTEMAGFRTQRAVPAIQNAAHLRDHPQATLVDLPVRLFLNSLGRIGPDATVVAKDLERLCKGGTAATGAAAAAGGDALDFSKK
ncbi:MAG TPA: hypothetical protein VFB08_03985 [Burkholderiales bacterium]|nr:hypothetical protein [Burkholderiales bacterium]